MCITIISKGTKLYRYDVEKLQLHGVPSKKNKEYKYPKLGDKNKFGGFFFFDSYEQALCTGEKVLNKNDE